LVSRLLVCALFLAAVPVWGGQQRQLCLSCHSTHYVERGTCSDCHRGNPASERKNIAHAGLRAGKFVRFTLGDVAHKRAGEHLLGQLACRRCHVSAGRGNGLATSLDVSAARKTVGELALSIRQPVASMPKFGLDDERITMLINSLFTGSEGREMDKAVPLKVHFNNSGTKNEDIFSKKCGSCHRTLTERLGALGAGNSGPNLSGLFSQYYPKTFKNGETWTARNLGDWLKNPRDIQMWARMQPVVLTEREMAELVTIFPVSPESAL
jgi:mono/diheme cytochrome c family protein